MAGGKRTIGVLGGMGPEATVLFMQKMIAAVEARDDADHIPLLVDNNTQVPSRIKAIIEGGGSDPGPVLGAMARMLAMSGAKALAMPCNTAHHFAAQISAATDVPFLNMVELAAAHGRRLAGEGGRIGILGSPALRIAGVFDGPLAARGLVPVYSPNQSVPLEIIRTVKAHGVTMAAARQLNEVAASLLDEDCAAIMVCCTEFSLLRGTLSVPAPVFDTLDCLVEACVAFSLKG